MNYYCDFQAPKNKKIFMIFLFVFVVYTLANITISSVLFFVYNYPDSYSWTELYINYEGGLIRRGLLGQILFCCAHVLGVKASTILIFSPAYVIFIVLSIHFFYKNVDILTMILIVASPGLLFFFTQDRCMLCRKDIFYELGFIIQFSLLTIKRINTVMLFIFMITIYVICFLIHESTIFYAVLPFAIFLERAYNEKKFFVYFIVLCIVACCSLWFLVSFPGTIEQRHDIINAWSQFFTLSTDGALRYIGKSMSVKLSEEQFFYTASAWRYFIAGLILTSFPVFYYAFKINIITRLKKLFLLKFNLFIVVLGCTIPWVLPFIAVDFGRHIHTGSYYTISFFATVVALTGGLDKKCHHRSINISSMLWILLFIYVFGWKLWHYADYAHILSFSFPIRAPLVGWLPSLNPS